MHKVASGNLSIQNSQTPHSQQPIFGAKSAVVIRCARRSGLHDVEAALFEGTDSESRGDRSTFNSECAVAGNGNGICTFVS